MNAGMATRTPRTTGARPGDSCTEFQLHKSQNAAASYRHILDYTSHRLLRYIDETTDDQQKSTLQNLLHDYRAGKIAIAWKSGKPIWMNVTKG
jgi:DNA topoisomerase IB